MSKGTGETVVSKRTGGAGRGTRQKVITLTENEKENIDVHVEEVGLNHQNKSPLPLGYPRLPLQDITVFLRPLSDHLDEESNTKMRKPFTRAQGLRKTGKVRTTVFSGSNSKNVTRVAASRADLSKNQKKQVIKIAIDESKPVILPGDPGQVQQDAKNISSSVNLTEQTQKGQTDYIFSPVEEATVDTVEETNASGSLRSVPITYKDEHIKIMQASLADTEQRRGAPRSVQITDKDNHVTTMQVSFTDTELRRGVPGELSESSALGTVPGNQFYQDLKRRRPLLGRSSVSRFR